MKKVISFILLIIFYIPLLIIFPVTIIGRKHLPRKGRVILCCNHQSTADPIVMWSRIFRRRFNYMAKESLFKNKFGGYICRCIGGYPVNRDTTDIKALKTTLGLLKQEKAVCIFPEGTRVKEGDAHQLKNGVIIFALKTNAPIVPAHYTRKVRAFRFTRLIIGESFNLAEEIGYNQGDKITQEVIDAGIKVLTEQMFGITKGEK